MILLTVYWVSEAIPYAVTSLLPLSFFPLAGIIPSEIVGLSYFKVSNYCSFLATNIVFKLNPLEGHLDIISGQHVIGPCYAACRSTSSISIARSQFRRFVHQMVNSMAAFS